MATVEQCRAALHTLAERLAAVDEETRSKYVVDRTVSCRLTDLDVVFRGRISGDGLTGITEVEEHAAQVRLTTTSEDLLALSEGRLGVPAAWATGRLKIEASVLDLLRLRSLL